MLERGAEWVALKSALVCSSVLRLNQEGAGGGAGGGGGGPLGVGALQIPDMSGPESFPLISREPFCICDPEIRWTLS